MGEIASGNSMEELSGETEYQVDGDYHLRIMNCFLDTLLGEIESGLPFCEVEITVMLFTWSLMKLQTPLGEWNCIAQYVLTELRNVDCSGGKFVFRNLKTLNSFHEKIEECLAIIQPGTNRLGELEEILSTEAEGSTAPIDSLQPSKLLSEAWDKSLQELWKGSIRFSYHQLEAATRCFHPTLLVYLEDRYPKVYRAELSGEHVFITAYKGRDAANEFLNDVRAFATLEHPNIAKGIGWCRKDRSEFFTVQELVDNGTLYDHLHGPYREPLSWDRRVKIARGLASSILYMHEQCVSHGAICSSCVLLDSHFSPKLTSFRNVQFRDNGRSLREDVVRLGNVLIEIVSGLCDIKYLLHYNKLRYLCSSSVNVEELVSEIADERLEGAFDTCQMGKLITVGLNCALEHQLLCPAIQDVVEFLKFEDVSLPSETAVDVVPSHGSSPPSSPSGKMEKRLDTIGDPDALPDAIYFQYSTRASLNESNNRSSFNVTSERKTMLVLEAPGIPELSHQQLYAATNGFKSDLEESYLNRDASVLHRIHATYKGDLFGKKVLILKCQLSCEQHRRFLESACIFGRLRHPNIVQVVGWCRGDSGSFFIAHEFMEKGTLMDHLDSKNESPPLPWNVRLKIILHLSSAVLHMHQQEDVSALPKGIKSANILLDSDLNPKIGLRHHLEDWDVSIPDGDFIRATDVYNFGILVLDISKVADERLNGAFDELQMEKLIELGLKLTRPDSERRPTMKEVVRQLGAMLSPGAQEFLASHREAQPADAALMSESSESKEHQEQDDGFTFDIGMPKDYDGSSKRMTPPQIELLKDMLDNVRLEIEYGAGFTDVLQIIKSSTRTLTTLGVPLGDWNSLAQYVLKQLLEEREQNTHGDGYRTTLSNGLTKRLQRKIVLVVGKIEQSD